MLGGIIFQLGKYSTRSFATKLMGITVSVIIFSALGFEFFFRYLKDEPVREVQYGMANKGLFGQRVRRMAFGLFFSTLCIFIRYVLILSLLN